MCLGCNSLRFIIRLLAEAVELLGVPGVFAFLADELSHALALLLRNSNAVPVEPIVAQVAPDVELGVIVGGAARAEELLLAVSASGAAGRRRALLPLLGRRLIGRARRRGGQPGRRLLTRGRLWWLGAGGGRSAVLALGGAHLLLLVALGEGARGQLDSHLALDLGDELLLEERALLGRLLAQRLRRTEQQVVELLRRLRLLLLLLLLLPALAIAPAAARVTRAARTCFFLPSKNKTHSRGQG